MRTGCVILQFICLLLFYELLASYERFGWSTPRNCVMLFVGIPTNSLIRWCCHTDCVAPVFGGPHRLCSDPRYTSRGIRKFRTDKFDK